MGRALSAQTDAPAKRRKVRPTDGLAYLAVRAVLAVASVLPERPAYALLGAIGRLYFRCSKKRQRRALAFLRHARPDLDDRQRLALARVATGNLAKVALDGVRVVRWLRRGRLRDRVDTSAIDPWMPKPPFVAVTAHLGSWEIAAFTMATYGDEAHGIARPVKNPLLQRFIVESRRKGGLIVHPKRGGIRDLARALEQGKIGLQVVDQHQRLRGVVAPFFGVPVSCDRSAAVLALRKGYPLLVGGAVRVGPGFRFRMVGFPPIELPPTGDHDRDVVALVTEINRRLETLILDCPEQYMWIHNRFRDAARRG